MGRRTISALVVIAAGWFFRAAVGCNSSPTSTCNAGCLCFGVEACPVPGCFPSRNEQDLQVDGALPPPFCSNGIVACADGGLAWSTGEPATNCPGQLVYLDSGPAPSGAFCCDYAFGSVGDSSAPDAGGIADAGADGFQAPGCGSAVMTYQCDPVLPDAAACVGPTADGGTAFYPIGCVAAEPGCTAASVPPSPLQCTCTANVAVAFGDAQAVFICPD